METFQIPSFINNFQERESQKLFDKSENDIRALQSVGQIVGEVLKQLTEDKFIVKATNGPRYVVGCRRSVAKDKLKQVFKIFLFKFFRYKGYSCSS